MTSNRSNFNSVAERLQYRPIADQALTLSRIMEERTGGIVRPRDVAELFDLLGLPAPSNMSTVFRALKQRKYLTSTRILGEWRVTPVGRGESERPFSPQDLLRLLAGVNTLHFAQLGNQAHALVPPSLAPPALMEAIGKFNKTYPFDTNVFGMTRFPSEGEDDTDPLTAVLHRIAVTTAEHGLEFHLASDRAIVDDLWGNVAGHMWASRYGIAIFEDRRDRGMSYNLAIEVGGMLTMGRRCLLLKDKSISSMPTDLVGMIYKSIDLDDLVSVDTAIHEWVRGDLVLGSLC